MSSSHPVLNPRKSLEPLHIAGARFFIPNARYLAQDFRLLSIMLRANLSLKDALAALITSSQNPILRHAYARILHQLQVGRSVAEAFSHFQNVFSPLSIALIKLSAESNSLPSVIDSLAHYFHALATHRTNIKKSLFYPAFVLASTCIAFLVIVFVVIPPFAELFTSLDATLPISTRALLFCSWLLQEYWLWILGGVLIPLVLLLYSISKKNIFYHLCMKGILRLPNLGATLIYRELWGYFLGFFYLSQAQIDVNKALPIAITSITNPIIYRAIKQASKDIEQGASMKEAFLQSGYVDTTLLSFIAAGEHVGELGEVFELCAQYCNDMYEQHSTRFQAIIEPCSTMLTAVFVSWLAFGIFLPIWELGSIGL